jgi:hypothetical protein
MAITLTADAKKQAIASIKRYFEGACYEKEFGYWPPASHRARD